MHALQPAVTPRKCRRTLWLMVLINASQARLKLRLVRCLHNLRTMLAIAALVSSAAAFGPKGNSKKNVLYFIADDLRPEFAAPYWQKQVGGAATPQLLPVSLPPLPLNKMPCLFSMVGAVFVRRPFGLLVVDDHADSLDMCATDDYTKRRQVSSIRFNIYKCLRL